MFINQLVRFGNPLFGGPKGPSAPPVRGHLLARAAALLRLQRAGGILNNTLLTHY